MLWVFHLQTVKQFVKGTDIAVVILFDFSCTQKLHNHRKILLVLWCFVFQIEHQSQKQHTRRRIPERVLRLASFGRGRLEEIGHKPLHIVIAFQIDKGIVTMALVHIDKVKNTHLIAFLLQKTAYISDDFALWV